MSDLHPGEVSKARQRLLDGIPHARTQILHNLDSGCRDYADLRHWVEIYIDLLKGADALAGYVHVQKVQV